MTTIKRITLILLALLFSPILLSIATVGLCILYFNLCKFVRLVQEDQQTILNEKVVKEV